MKAWPALVLLAACGAEKSERVPAAKAAKAAPETPQRDPTADEIADMRAAAATLRLYYDNLGTRDYRAAWALREQRPGLDFERFAESFARYRDYHADVGTPSFPAAADGFVWIDAPVQTWGTETSGARFGNVGRVLLKRRAGTRAWKLAP